MVLKFTSNFGLCHSKTSFQPSSKLRLSVYQKHWPGSLTQTSTLSRTHLKEYSQIKNPFTSTRFKGLFQKVCSIISLVCCKIIITEFKLFKSSVLHSSLYNCKVLQFFTYFQFRSSASTTHQTQAQNCISRKK